MKPRVFISSTCYDLAQIRKSLSKFITNLGYDEPTRNEKGTVPYGNDQELERYCYAEIKNIDILVSIIGNTFGSQSRVDNKFSISQMEVKVALKEKKQVFVFVKKDVHDEYKTTFQNNKDNPNIKYSSVNDSRIFDFIHKIYSLDKTPDWGRINSITDFKTEKDIKQYLKNQWAGLFQRLLDEKTRNVSIFKDSYLDFQQLGIIGTVNKLSQSIYKPLECMQETEHSLYFMGILGSKWIKDRKKFQSFLAKCQEKDGQVRFLMINPYSESFKLLKDMREKNLKDKSTKIFRELVKKYPCLEARYYNFLPNFRLIFIDNKNLAVSRYGLSEEHYLKTQQGWDSPHLVIQRESDFSLFDPFLLYYNHIWANSTEITNLKIHKNGKV